MNPFSFDEYRHNIRRLDYLKQSGKTDAELKTAYIENNVINVDLDTPIYRIFSEQRFFQMLDERALTLVQTQLWRDPFENFLLRARWELPDGTLVDVSSTRDRYYGQCWTLRRECDGLWNNYRGSVIDPEHPPVAIKVATTVRKLMEEFYDMNTSAHYMSHFLGKVRYRTDEEIADFFTNPEQLNSPVHESGFRRCA